MSCYVVRLQKKKNLNQSLPSIQQTLSTVTKEPVSMLTLMQWNKMVVTTHSGNTLPSFTIPLRVAELCSFKPREKLLTF